MSELPKGWVWVRLGSIGKVSSGGTPSTKDQTNFNGDVPWITPADLSGYNGKFISRGRRNLSINGLSSSSAKLLPKGTVVYSSRAPIGYVAIAKNSISTNQGFKNLTVGKYIFNEYVYSYLKGNKRMADSFASGTTFRELSANRFSQIPIPLPPLPEQRRIVAKIEELFTRLDVGVEALKRVKKELKRYRQAVLKSAFEGKLTAEWRKAHKDELEPASVLLERIKEERKRKAKEKRKELPPLDSSDLPQLPEGWIWARLGSIGKVSSGGTPSTRDQTNFNGDIPWITPADLSGYNGKFISRGRRNLSINGLTSSAKLLPKGTILYSSRAPIGYVAIAKNSISTNQGFKNLTVGKHIFNEYVYFCLRGSKSLADSFASGTTFRELSANRFSQIPFPLSPFPEQHKIVEEIESRFSVADEVERTVEQSLKQAGRLRQSILKKAFEGKLVAQHPSDEPAEKLLERIKAEKAKWEIGKKRKKRGKTRINLKQRELL